MKLSYNLICQESQGACNIRAEENTQLFPAFSWGTAGKRQSLKLHGLKLTRGRMYRWLKPSLHLPRRKTTVDFKKKTHIFKSGCLEKARLHFDNHGYFPKGVAG